MQFNTSGPDSVTRRAVAFPAHNSSIRCRAFARSCFRLLPVLLPLGFSLSARADGPLMPVHLRVGGREVVCKTAPVADNDETYIPLEALAAVGLEGKPDTKREMAHVTILATRKQEDIAIARPNGKSMLPLSAVAHLVNARIVRTEQMGRDSKPIPGSKGDTIYLLARITEVRFQNNALRITTSFPVPYQARMITDEKPMRGYVDCIGSEVEGKFQPETSRDNEKQGIKLRASQYSIDTARVVAELPMGVVMKYRDMTPNPSAIIVAETGRLDTKVALGPKNGDKNQKPEPQKSDKKDTARIARATPKAKDGHKGDGETKPVGVVPMPGESGDQGDTSPLQQPGRIGADKTVSGNKTDATTTNPNVTPNPAATDNTTPKPPVVAGEGPGRPSIRGKSPSRGGNVKRTGPIEVRGLSLVPDGDARIHLDIATSDSVGTYIHYLPDSKLAVDLPNTLLHLPEGVSADQTLTHPLVNGIHAELVQETPPLTRVTIDTSRFVGFTVNNQANKVSVDLRLPRNATGALADKVIVIDPGHGGSSTGATGGGFQEKNITLQISLKLREILEACGAKVVMTRDKDVDVNLYDRPYLANDINADLFVSIHNDSFTSDCRGTSTYFHMSDPSSRALANCVQQAIASLHEVPSKGALSDGILYNSGLAVLRASKMPAILVEVAYISNTQDRRKLIDGEFQQHIAQAICDGLRQYVEGGTPNGGRRMGMDVPDAPPLPGDPDTSSFLLRK